MASDENADTISCEVCGIVFANTDEWVGLNRWSVNSGNGYLMIAAGEGDGYKWDYEAREATMLTLCWPGCASMYINAEMVAVAANARKRRKKD